jgi:EAL domain-containing protein (putative c-di-GMP-specific phosphodiesterase class I)
MLQSFNTVGTDCALAMLPPLQKPLTAAMVHKVILAQKLHAPATTASVALSEALAANWVGFLYQPKFDLKSGTMVGAELVARVVHPEHGLLMPDLFLMGADEDALIALSRLALTAALKASVHFHGIGIALQLAVNISADTLLRVPVADIAMLHRPDSINWPGLLLEIPERQVVSKIEFLKARAAKLQQAGVSIAIDNFGRGACRMDIFKLLQFAEIKVDRSLVHGCSVDTGNANICKTLIQMGHNFGCRTAAVGISDAEDMRTIRALGCDIGQGFQLSKPMTLKAINELIASFKNRDP